MKNSTIKVKLNPKFQVWSLDKKMYTAINADIVEVYLIKITSNIHYFYFSWKGKKYRVDENSLVHQYKVGQIVNTPFKDGKKTGKDEVKIDYQCKVGINGIKCLSYIATSTKNPNVQYVVPEPHIYPKK